MPRFALFPSTMKCFTRNGSAYRRGDTLRQPDLASTLRAVILRGRDGFYAGDVAAKVAAEAKRDGGIITGMTSAHTPPSRGIRFADRTADVKYLPPRPRLPAGYCSSRY